MWVVFSIFFVLFVLACGLHEELPYVFWFFVGMIVLILGSALLRLLWAIIQSF